MSVRNLLANPSFDDPSYLNGWQVYGYVGNPTVSLSTITPGPRWQYGLAGATQYSLEVSLPPNSGVSFGNLNFIPVDPNVDYYGGLSYWASNTEVRLRVMMKYYTSGFIHLETQYNEFTATGWTTTRIVSVPPPNATFVRFGFRLINTSTTTTRLARVDECFMMPVSYPLVRGWWQWSNVFDDYSMTVSKNTIRIYSIFTVPYDSASTTSSSVYIAPAILTFAGIIASAEVKPYPSINQVVYNPPIYDGNRLYPNQTWRIGNLRPTGGIMIAVVYYNTADYWTTNDI